MKNCIILLSLFLSLGAFANAEEDLKIIRYVPRVYDAPPSEKALNFGLVYAGQLAYYFTLQKEILEDHGSWRNWRTNMLSPHFDKDSFDYNIFKHGITGNYYYIFYRSRGYDRVDAFLWTFLSSLAFEFTIETATERPSYQDIYQTPVYGTVLGIGVEKLSLYFHEKDNWWGHTLGYILNPFTLIPPWDEDKRVSMRPFYDGKKSGAMVTYDF